MSTISELTAQEYLRIQTNRNTIRAKLVELNLAVSTATLDALAAAIDGIVNRGTINANVQEGETYTVEPGYYAGGTVAGVKGGGNYTLQEKTTTPTKKAQTVVSDSGYYGLSAVVVNPIPENYQDVSGVTATAPDVLLGKVIVRPDGSVAVGTMANNGTPDQKLDVANAKYVLTAGYYAGGTISVTVEEKTVTPTKSEQVITPSTGKVLSKVTVGKIPDAYQDVTKVTATADKVLTGSKIVDAEGNVVEGTMVNHYRGLGEQIVLTPSDRQYTVPEGYYPEGNTYVKVSSDSKSVTPTKQEQVVTHPGAFLDSVTVKPIPAKYQDISGVTATGDKVLEGVYFINSNGDEEDGRMPDNGEIALTFDPLTQSSVSVPAGHTSGGAVTMTDDLLNALKAI